MNEAIIIGEKKIHDFITVQLRYELNGNKNIEYIKTKKFKNVEAAILYIWNFQDNYRLCLDCCRFIKKDQECEECMFYKYFALYKNKKEYCGICGEETSRIILTCKHQFHRLCLLKMDSENLKCPLCRCPIHNNIILDLYDSSSDIETIDYYSSDDESL